MMVIRRILAEPILHFLFLGTAIFVASSVLAPQQSDTPETIIVTQDRIASLETKFTRTWQRLPSDSELEDLIEDFIREEVAVREAKRLGIDHNDTVIRRLLRQRLEFVTDDVAALTEPTGAELSDYLQAHAEKFRTETRVSFRQVFFDPQRRGAALSEDIQQVRTQLSATDTLVNAASFGDTTLLGHQFTALSLITAAQMFGPDFTAALQTQTPGVWSGPVGSAYGQHLVYVSEITPGTVPGLERIRDIVRREVLNARRNLALDAYYAALLQRYRVRIDRPSAPPGHDQLAELH